MAVELRNHGYAIRLIQTVLKDNPGFLDGRKLLRRVEILSTKGKKAFLSGLSTASLRGASVMKKDPKAAMELGQNKRNLNSFASSRIFKSPSIFSFHAYIGFFSPVALNKAANC